MRISSSADSLATGTRPCRQRPDDGIADRRFEALAEASDALLLSMVRQRNVTGFAELYRRHRAAARRYARQLTRHHPSSDVAEDVVSEAMRKVLSALLHGHGPHDGFRTYLFTSIRSVALSMASRPEPVLDGRPHDHDAAAVVDDGHDAAVVMAAFASLPTRWRRVLWLTEALDLTPTDAAPMLGQTPTAVAMLAMRARQALRVAYMRQHLPSPTDPQCRRALDLLSRRSVATITHAQARYIEQHTLQCEPCGNAARDVAEHLVQWARSDGSALNRGLQVHPGGRRDLG